MRPLLLACLLCATPAIAQDAADQHRYWEIPAETEAAIHEREIAAGRSCRTDGCYLESVAIILALFGMPGMQ